MRGLAALSLLFALVGCWTGDEFYSASDLRAPIVPGDYRMLGPYGEEDDGFRIEVLPNGLTSFGPPPGRTDEPLVAGYALLTGETNIYVGWLTAADGDTMPPGQTPYGLLEVLPDGEYRVLTPTCFDMQALATSAGANVIPDTKVRMCRFPDRASLERGLRSLIPRIPTEGARLVPAPRD